MLIKGTKIGMNGELTNRAYTAKDGTEKYSLDLRVNDVTLLGGKVDSNTQSNRDNAPQRVKQPDMSIPIDEIDSDVIPF